jgi:HK97 family phage major capsid protein
MNLKEELKEAQTEYKQLREKLKTIARNAIDEDRAMTGQEIKSFDDIEADLKIKDHEIQKLTEKIEMQKRDKAAEAVSIPGPYSTKNVQDVDIARLIVAKATGNPLSENEKEFIKEGQVEAKRFGVEPDGIAIPTSYLSKEAYQASSVTSTISTDVYKQIDLTVEDSPLKKLGVREIPVKYGNSKLVFSGGASSDFKAEGANLTDGAPTLTNDSIAPRRVGGFFKYSLEWLKSSVPQNVDEIINDCVSSIDRAQFEELITTMIADSNIIDGSYEAADTAKVLASSDIFALMATLTGEDTFKKPGIVMSKPIFYLGAQTGYMPSSVETPLFKEDRKFFGWPIVPTEYLPVHDTSKYDLILGDFYSSYVFNYGPVMMLVDPYSSSVSGDITVTFQRLSDISYNPNKFAAGRNFDLS